MLKTNDIKITPMKLEGTEISVSLVDPEVHSTQYRFFKDRVNNYKLYIHSEYSLKTETKYDESSQILSIGINIIIPDHLIPIDPFEAQKTINDPINVFKLFYEAQTELYKRKSYI